uniref:Small ribosomal subunit protein bS6m n=2 Tax=Clastoptera arizonana TaxID=38151 RepID=A0A1B6BXI6_9HEMI
MPTYELALLLRVLPKPETATVLKRTANTIFENGGFLRKLDNVGTRKTPYKISSHGAVHKEASYFVFQFDYPPTKIKDLLEVYGRDVDIVRRNIFKVEEPTEYECTIDEEIMPAPYRKEVIKMIELGKKKAASKKQFKYNTGLDYYPFQK